MSDMNSCPFCGGLDIRWSKSYVGHIRFKCMGCHAEGPPLLREVRGESATETTKLRTQEALNLWNRRAAPPVSREVG